MPTWKAVQYSTNGNTSRSHTSNIISEWVAGCNPRSYIFTSPALRSEYCTSSRCKEDWQKPIRYVTIYLQDRRGVALLRYKNSAEITVLMCPQKLYPV